MSGTFTVPSNINVKRDKSEMESTCFCNKSVYIIADALILFLITKKVNFNATIEITHRTASSPGRPKKCCHIPYSYWIPHPYHHIPYQHNHYCPIMPHNILWCPIQLISDLETELTETTTDFTSPLSQVSSLLVQLSKDSADKLSHMRVLFFRAIFPLIQTHAYTCPSVS